MPKFNEQSKIKDLLADERAEAIIRKYLPNILKYPMMKMGYEYTLEKALGYRMLIGLSAEKENLIKKEIFSLE